MKSKANIIVGAIIVVVLAVAIGMFASSQMRGADAGGLQAVVHDGDGNETRLSLSKDQEFTAQTSLGENVIVIEDGNVYVREADCDNQDCVHQGKISSPGRQIICLPHKLWIEVVADGTEGAADMDPSVVAGDGSELEDLDAVTR